ncbi:MAG: caspase family protein [Cyclobacteriaceae bacterium]
MRFILQVFLLMGVCWGLSQPLPVELRIQSGHHNKVNVVTFSPDGKLLASGGYDRNIIIWDVKTGRELRRLECNSSVETLDFNSSSTMLLAVTQDGVAAIWDVNGAKLKTLGGEKQYLKTGKFMPDGKRFITGGGSQTATLWSLDEEEPLRSYKGDRFACTDNCQRAMDISPKGKYLLTTNREGEVTLWDIKKGEQLRTYKKYPDNRHSSSVTSMAFLPDGVSFLVGSEDEGILKWSVRSDQDPVVLLEPQRVTSGLKFQLNDLTINAQGTHAAVLFLEGIQGSFKRAKEQSFHLIDLETAECQSRNLGVLKEMRSLEYHPATDTIVLADGAELKLYAPSTDSTIDLFRGHLTDHLAPYWIMKVTPKHLFLPSKKSVIERVGNAIYRWGMTTGKILTKYPAHEKLALALALSPDSAQLATGGEDHHIYVSDVNTGVLLWEKETSGPVFAMSYSPDGTKLFSAHLGGRIIVWNATTGDYIKDLSGGYSEWFDTPFALQFTGTGLATWGDFLVDHTTGERLVQFDDHTDRVHDIQISKDGKSMLTTGWDGKVILRELYYGGKVTEFEGHEGHVFTAAFSPDETKIATGGADNRILLWNTSGEMLGQLTGHTSPVTSLSFHPDGNYLISGSQDGSIRVWNLDTKLEVYTHIVLDEDRWMVKIPSGHFYATQEAQKEIFFVQGTESYRLEQFFEEYYEPKLSLNLLAVGDKERTDLQSRILTNPPPSVEIVYPQNGSANQTTIQLVMKVTDEGGGINEVKVLQNGKRIVEDHEIPSTKKGKPISRSYYIDLVPGVNFIDATAFNNNRVESGISRIRLTRPADEPTATCYVLSIGINKYKNPRLNLNYAVNDALSISGLLEQHGKDMFTDVEVISILDEEATKANIIAKLQELSKKVRPTDVFYFFYAGHGSLVNEQFYFIPTDATRLYEESSLQEDALFVGDMVGYLKEIKALKQVVMIDACHSGGSTSVLAARGAAEEKALAQLSRSAGVHILAAAGSDQTATEFAELGHGLFTYVILEAQNGKADGAPADDKVTVYELKSFLDDQVPEYSLKYKNAPQYPNTFSIGHDFPMVLKKE